MTALARASLAAIVAALAACGGSADSTSPGVRPAKTATVEQSAAEGARGKAQTLFKSLCGVCHTLAVADAHGTVGPNLDEMRPTPAEVRIQLRRTIALPPAEERALIDYVVANAGKGGQDR